jgi:glycogen debranching enzyme
LRRSLLNSIYSLPTNFSKPIHVDLPISHAGAFCYWVEYDGAEHGAGRVKGREGYFNIDPIMRTKGGKTLPLDALSILTVVSKWMGPLSAWADHYSEASERGYTMLHYTPLQHRGESDSPYSIQNQHAYDPTLFGGGKLPQDGGEGEIVKILKNARENYGLLSLTDVVLNHTASDSPWLREHPEAGSSTCSSPEL